MCTETIHGHNYLSSLLNSIATAGVLYEVLVVSSIPAQSWATGFGCKYIYDWLVFNSLLTDDFILMLQDTRGRSRRFAEIQ